MIAPVADTPDVLVPGHGFEMVGVEARRVDAQMVDLQRVGDRPTPNLPGDTMCAPLFLRSVHPDHAVPGGDTGGGELPAAGVGDGAVVQESLLVAERLFQVAGGGVDSVAPVEGAEPTRPDLAGAAFDGAGAARGLPRFDGGAVRVLSSSQYGLVGGAESSGVVSSFASGAFADPCTCHEVNYTGLVQSSDIRQVI